MTDLTPLIKRIEEAEEGSNKLDRELRKLTGTVYSPHAYTSSIDAIVGLIERELPGWGRSIYSGPGQSWAELHPDSNAGFLSVIKRENAEPLALCAAFLRAVQAKRPPHP